MWWYRCSLYIDDSPHVSSALDSVAHAGTAHLPLLRTAAEEVPLALGARLVEHDASRADPVGRDRRAHDVDRALLEARHGGRPSIHRSALERDRRDARR